MAFRILNPDGSFNVLRRGPFFTRDLYHRALATTWPRFLLLVAAAYVAVNLSFGAAYCLCGQGALENLRASTPLEHYLGCVFFSVQTLATIGYGRVSPVGLAANLLVSLEALVGLMSLAVVTGLLYARFARPTARVRFSKNALINTTDGQRSLIFRMANERLNQIVEAQVNVILLVDRKTAEGGSYRFMHDLQLRRDHSPVFGLSWTIVHPINEQSPFFGLNAQALAAQDSEIIVSLSGTDETFAQTIHARYSYAAEEILFERSFEDMIVRGRDGQVSVLLDRISELRS